MNSEFDDMLQAYGPVKMVSKKVLGLPQEDWFVLQISPTPDKDDILRVVADIKKDRNIGVFDGKLFHAESCTANGHRLSKEIMDVLENIQSTTFSIAVYRGNKDLMGGQPIAIALEPEITYHEYPDHPHLNTGVLSTKTGTVVIPCSLCYTDKPADLGKTEDMKLYSAFNYISVWLFRHQVWLETRRVYGKGTWIGPQVYGMTADAHLMHFNPQGICYCGIGRRYFDCHMANDYSTAKKVSINESRSYVRSREPWLSGEYTKRILVPQQQELQRLKSCLLRQ